MDPDENRRIDMQHMTVGQYLDMLLESELDSIKDAAKKCEEKFQREAKKVEAEIMKRAQIRYDEFKARRAQA